MQRTLLNEAKRRVSLLIAQKSVKGFIGWMSRQVGSVPVGRAQDAAVPGKGTIYLPDPIHDPTLVRGIGTDFEKEAEVGGILFLPSIKGQNGSSVDVVEIIGPEEIRIKRPFKGRLAMVQLTARDDVNGDADFQNTKVGGSRPGYGGTKYKLAPHIDQTKVYQAVFDRLKNGGCVGIFPEGGSHDRTELLPLKAGVAIMALGTLAEAPDCGLKIVPVGMNYFHAHKFRSRAVVEFGPPFEIPAKFVEMYKYGDRRAAIGEVLDTVHAALNAVTVSTPNYETLMVIQAARRLYNTSGKKLPLPVVVELNRRLAMGYEKHKDDERIVRLRKSVMDYNKQLRYLNIRDHQVDYVKMSWPKVVFTFLYRLTKLLLLSAGVLPGLILFGPVFIATKIISHQKAKAALAGSTVKIQGKDVIATWKLLVSLAFAPVLYNFYTCVAAYLVYKDGLGGRVPEWVPIWGVFLAGWVIFPTITFAALRFGEVGMDILKSLRPLALCINPTSSYNISQLRERRHQLSAQITDIINTLGPDMFHDFDRTRLVPDTGAAAPAGSEGTSAASPGRPPPQFIRILTENGGGTENPANGSVAQRNTTPSSRAIPRNESFSNIGHAPLFATRPPSRDRSRSSSAGGGLGMSGFPIGKFTALDSKEGFAHAATKIREAMRERGEMRRRRSQAQRGFGMVDGDGPTSDEAESLEGSVADLREKKEM